METWTWRHGDMDSGDMDIETWTWRHGIERLENFDVSRKNQTENESPGDFP
jgi:hypothetical protein